MTEKPTYEELEERIQQLEQTLDNHKSVEEALQESETRYRTLAQYSQTGIYIHIGGLMKFVNNKFAEMLGYTSEEIVGRQYWEFVHPGDREMVKKISLDRARGMAAPAEYEFRHLSKDGKTVWVHNLPTIIQYEGQIANMGNLAFINDRKQAEEALQQKMHDLGERTKKLNCLLGISNLVEDADNSIEMIIQGVVELIPPSWQYPEITCSRIILEDKEYKTENFKESSWKQSVDIIVRGERSGILEIYYLEEKLEIDEGPFLREERALINSIAERLGRIIERIRAEQALRDSEEKYCLLFNSSNDSIFVHQPAKDGIPKRFIEVNETAAVVYGYTREELLELTPADLMSREDSGKTSDLLKKILAKGQNVFEITHQTKKGEYFPAEVSAYTFEFQGTPTVLSITRNITERKRAEEELRRRESQYNAIVENTGDYIMRYDRNHRHIYANHGAIEATGLSPDQYLGKTHREMGFPDHLCALWEKNIDDVLATGEVRRVEFDVELQGGIVSLDLQMNPEFSADGQVQSVIGVSRDITALKEAQREDRLHKMRLEITNQIINTPDMTEKNVFDLVLEKMVDLLDSKIGFFGLITANEQEMQIHAWSSTAMTECAIHEKPIVFPIKKAGLWGEPVRNRKALIINDYTAEHPAKKGYPKGHVHISRFMSVPVFDKGRIVAVAAVANKTAPYIESDIKHFELLLRDTWEQVQRRRMEKEKETLTLKLQQAQKMESIGNLAGGIAHDFNNILFPIVGMSELLLEDLPHDSIERENAQEIFKAGKRGSDLVKQILAFSRQSEHKMMPTRIQEILKEVIKLSRSTIPTYIEIKQDIQQDCGMVLADPSQIHQIGINLITNANHAVEDKGGTILVGLKQTVIEAPEALEIDLSSDDCAVISISDTGHGISEELMGKIFDPYFTTKEQGKGTGLGLAVVHGIVREHGGDIKVCSEIGKGSTFEIYLPLMKKANGTESINEAQEYQGGNERILLVDDEEPVARLEKQMLERMGYTVTLRLHSVEALEAFYANPSSFDLVITDMSMPNMPGDQLAQKINSIRSDVPIIICTGFSERIDEDTIAQMGIDGLLMKPVVKADLAKTVRRILDEAKS